MAQLIVTMRDGTERRVAASAGCSIMANIRNDGFEKLDALCGDNLSRATCHVIVDRVDFARLPPISNNENELLSALPYREETSPLSCQIIFLDALDGLRVMVAAEE